MRISNPLRYLCTSPIALPDLMRALRTVMKSPKLALCSLCLKRRLTSLKLQTLLLFQISVTTVGRMLTWKLYRQDDQRLRKGLAITRIVFQ